MIRFFVGRYMLNYTIGIIFLRNSIRINVWSYADVISAREKIMLNSHVALTCIITYNFAI